MELPIFTEQPSVTKESAPDIRPEDSLEQKVVKVLRTVYDPEIPVNIYDLGLVYGLTVVERGAVEVRMTLTSPACPVAGSLPGAVESKIKQFTGVSDVRVTLVWEPPWSQEMMSEAARLQLGLF